MRAVFDTNVLVATFVTESVLRQMYSVLLAEHSEKCYTLRK